MTARHLLISGRVQGVGYRDWMVAEATARGITGWVRNRRDGRVEAMIEGPDDALTTLLTACRQGPRMARVDDIAESTATPSATPGFQRLPTA